MDSDSLRLITIDVGNSNTSLSYWDAKACSPVVRVSNNDRPAILAAVRELAKELEGAEHSAIVLASVKEPTGSELAQAVCDELKREVFTIPDDLPLACTTMLDPEALTGIDRLLAAIGAFDRFEQACAVVDAGTAITVDFIDGTGIFQGGAIVPGTRAWLAVLRMAAPALPEIEPARPTDGAFAKNTAQAMLHGMFYGIRGVVRQLIERYAEEYHAYPKVVATGGDAHLLFDGDEFVEQIAEDLVHRGMVVCAKRALAGAQCIAPLQQGAGQRPHYTITSLLPSGVAALATNHRHFRHRACHTSLPFACSSTEPTLIWISALACLPMSASSRQELISWMLAAQR